MPLILGVDGISGGDRREEGGPIAALHWWDFVFGEVNMEIYSYSQEGRWMDGEREEVNSERAGGSSSHTLPNYDRGEPVVSYR